MKIREAAKIIVSVDYFILSLKFLIPAIFIFVTTVVVHYEVNINKDYQNLLTQENHNIDIMTKSMSNILLQQLTDLNILIDSIDRNVFKSPDGSFDNNRLIEQFISFSNIRGVYDQIRIIDLSGDEVVRVNYDNGNAFAVPKSGLQNKSSRYYFKKTLSTPQNSFYVSAFDLNIENNTIELPLKPTLRFGASLFDRNNVLAGILLLNYNGHHLLDQFMQTAEQLPNSLMLVSPKGFWSINNKYHQPWTYTDKEKLTFGDVHPEAWPVIAGSDSQQISTQKGYYTFSTINNNDKGLENIYIEDKKINNPYHWKIVSFLDKSFLNNFRKSFFNSNKYFYFAFLFIIAVAVIIMTYWKAKHLRSSQQILFERHFKNSLENIQLAAITINNSGDIIFCNQYFLNKIGLSEDKVLNKNWNNTFVKPSDHPMVLSKLKETLTTRKTNKPFECHLKTNNKQTLLFNFNATMAVDAVGETFGITLIGNDITKAKEKSDRLRKLSAAVEQSPNVVMITTVGGIIEYVNPKFTQITGYSPKEIINKKPSILKSGETPHSEYKKLWNTITSGGSWTGLFHNKKKSGELYWETALISPIRDKNNNITHYLATKQDVTEKIQLEEEVTEKNKELHRNRELASVGRMANMVAHDIRNPLSTIKMGLQLLSRKDKTPSPEEEKELVKISMEQVRYMEEILSDLLSYSKPDELRREWISIEKLIASTLTSLHKPLMEKNIRPVLDIQKGLPTIFADPTRLRQVLTNLILNALQATESNENRDPVINIVATLLLADSGTYLELEVKDNGSGIDKKILESVFDPFVTTRAKGTGLGLAIIARIIDQHNGSIKLVNRKSAGIVATVILPINPTDDINMKA